MNASVNFTNLKKARLMVGLSQSEVATKLKVDQSTYQRWESGTHPIPKGKLSSLAKFLNTTVACLQGETDPPSYGNSFPEEQEYFGEVSIHFANGAKPLLASISEKGRFSIESTLPAINGRKFVTFETLDNRLVFVRKTAIEDLYLNHDACDDVGPEEYEFDALIQPPLLSDRFWSMVEELDYLELAKEFTEEERKNVLEFFGLPVADNSDYAEKYDHNVVDLYSSRARDIEWRLSATSKVRKLHVREEEYLFNTATMLDMMHDDEDGLGQIDISAEGFSTVFINFDAIDYISFPLHKFKLGFLESQESMIQK